MLKRVEERTKGTFSILTDETAPFLGSSLLIPWTCDWSGLLELEEKLLHAALGGLVLEGAVVDAIGVPAISHWSTLEVTCRQFLYTSWVPCLSA